MTEQRRPDERSFSWLCKLISSLKAPFRLLETAFWHNEKFDCLIFTSQQGWVKRATVQESDFTSLSQVLDHYNERYQLTHRYPNGPAGLCFCSLRGDRFLITSELFAQISDRRMSISQCSFLQECRPGHSSRDFQFRIVWKSGSYWPAYRLNAAQGRSGQILHKLVDSAKVILTVLREVKHRAVSELWLDFQRSASGEFWLCDSRRCLLGGALRPEHWTLVTDQSEDCASHTTSSVDSRDAADLPTKESHSRATQRLSIVHRRCLSQRSLSYYQPDFQELILRKYLKENNLDVELLSQPSEVLKDFERKYNIDGAGQGESMGRTTHTRGFSDMADKARTYFPGIRRTEDETPERRTARRRHTKENTTA